MATLNYPNKIDRFEIQDILGKGAQGVVYLAKDSSLNRHVAIKAVHMHGSFHEEDKISSLLTEAKTVSQLQHNNIVTIFDVGTYNNNPYLVLEYIKGDALNHEIAKGIDTDQAISYMSQILSGVSAAHKKDIIHCDLKPANILITEHHEAKITDFGLAQLSDAQREMDDGLMGTPQYMAPEYIETQQHQKVSDVFSLGLIFYEMLTGKPAIQGEDIYQILNAIANTEIPAPSTVNSLIDEKLDDLILKALEKNPQNRFQDAISMFDALDDYLSSNQAALASDSTDSTVNFLLRRMRHKKDFPVFSKTISVLNRASASDTEGLAAVSNAILKDYSLTNKVLRVVNSAYYNRGGGKISTISRALVMLGINPVRNIAASLLLFDHMQNKQQSHQLKDDSVSSLFCAFIANHLAFDNKVKNHEEAFLCAMLQKLGKFLVRYYLHEESVEIDKLIHQKHQDEETASVQVLGMPFHEIGIAVAKEWGFPDQFINSMKPIDIDNLKEPKNDNDKLALVSSFSNHLGNRLQKPLETHAEGINDLIERFDDVLKIDDAKVSKLIESTHKELTDFSKIINFDLSKSRFYQQLSSSGDEVIPTAAEETKNKEFGNTQKVEILEESFKQAGKNIEKALTDGIQDITNTLTSTYTINQVMQMILETIYRALEGSRVLLALKGRDGYMNAKYGYGEGIDTLIQNFSVPLKYEADVFHVAFKNNVDIKIEDSKDAKIRNKIPLWFHNKIGSKSFIIFPIVIKHSPVALIYIDGENKKSIKISDSQLSLLKTLRNQAILAIKNLS